MTRELSDFPPIYCEKCGSYEIVKAGFSYTKQRIIQKYKCQSCDNKDFDMPFKRVRHSIKLIQYVISMQEAMSSYQLQAHLKKDLKIELSNVTICYWRKKFNPDNERILKKFSKNRVKDYSIALPLLQLHQNKIVKAITIKKIFGYSKKSALCNTFVVKIGWIDWLGNGFYYVNGIHEKKNEI